MDIVLTVTVDRGHGQTQSVAIFAPDTDTLTPTLARAAMSKAWGDARGWVSAYGKHGFKQYRVTKAARLVAFVEGI